MSVLTSSKSPWATGLLAVLAAFAITATAVAAGYAVRIEDPKGDDKGPGTYEYPTDAAYKKGSFDLRSFEVEHKGSNVSFTVEIDSRIEDPWDSPAWGGNGFSVQMAFIFIDTDHKKDSGFTEGLPGLNVAFKPEEAWDRVVIISPQPKSRLQSEIDAKAAKFKDVIVIPTKTRAKGKKLEALDRTADLGATPQTGWGYQVFLQSNEGYPEPTDLLTRQVNEYNGPHRFGGGNDFYMDPHVIDMLGGPDVQYPALSAYEFDEDAPDNKDKYVYAVVPMVYPK